MHYGSGGYSIGLDPTADLGILLADGRVQPRAPGLTHAAEWTDVRYGDDLEVVRQAIRAMLTVRNSDGVDWNEWHQLTVLRTLAAAQKHPGFSDERESRYLVPSPSAADARQYRTSNAGRLISYIRLVGLSEPNIGDPIQTKLPIRAVMIGPPGGRAAEVKTVERFLEDCGYAGVNISQSGIPYRA